MKRKTAGGHAESMVMEKSEKAADGLSEMTKNGDTPKVEISKAKEKEGLTLQRTVTLLGAISFTVGTMIGSGIFISPTSVLSRTKSVGLNLIVWSLGGVLSLLGSLTVSELACRIPKHGGHYTYLREGMGDWLGFVFTWNYLLINVPGSLAVKCLTCAEYLISMMPKLCGSPQLPVNITALAIIVSLCILNMASNRMSVRTNIAFLFAKLLALAIIIVGGIIALITGNNRGNSELSSGFEGTSDDAASVASSFYFVMYAYGGWAQSNLIVEEVKNPKRNVPLAAIFGVLGVTVIYVLTNVSYLAVMSRGEMLASDIVAVTWGNAVFGSGVASFIIPLCVIFSTIGSANAGAFAAPRLVFAAARDGVIPEVMSYLHVEKKTPIPAIAIIISLAVMYASVSTIRKLIILLNVAEWFFAFLMSICLLIIRHRQPKDLHVPFKQPLPVIILFMLCSLYIVIMPWTKGVDFVLLYVIIFLIVGLISFFLFTLAKAKIDNCCEGLMVFLQLLLQIAPPMPYMAAE